MKKDTIILMCSPNIYHLNAQRAINSVKTTDLRRAELIVVDNQYDPNFSHTIIMDKMLQFAAKEGKNIIYLDDDVEIYDYDWIDHLYNAADRLEADIVGCAHIFENGAVNHEGYYIDLDGASEFIINFRHKPGEVISGAVYVPTLCSAVMLVRDCGSFHFDDKYKKYQQDLDICMQAWQMGKKVACVLGLRVFHQSGYTAGSSPNFGSIYGEDAAYLAKKWSDFIPAMLDIPELRQYKTFGQKQQTWLGYYKVAGLKLRNNKKEEAIKMYRHIAKDCYNQKIRSGACFHLYLLEKKESYLKECLKANPCHGGARRYLQELTGNVHPRQCKLALDCRICYLKAQIEERDIVARLKCITS